MLFSDTKKGISSRLATLSNLTAWSFKFDLRIPWRLKVALPFKRMLHTSSLKVGMHHGSVCGTTLSVVFPPDSSSFLDYPDLATADTATVGIETSTIVLFLVIPTGQPFGLFVNKSNSLPPFMPWSMVKLFLNWIIQDTVAGGLLSRLV